MTEAKAFAFTLSELSQLVDAELRRRGVLTNSVSRLTLNWDFSRVPYGGVSDASVIVLIGTVSKEAPNV